MKQNGPRTRKEGMTMTVEIERETAVSLDFDYEALIRQVIEAALDYEKCPYEVEVDVVLTDNAAIKETNRTMRGIDRPTDVLSFPMNEFPAPGDFSLIEEDEDAFNPDTGELMLGDIMISLDKVMEQAQSYGHSPKRELAFLCAHSMLHLMGYDHETEEESREMERRQEEILQLLGITREQG